MNDDNSASQPSTMLCSLESKECSVCQAGAPVLSREEAASLQNETPGWQLNNDATRIDKSFKFSNFVDTVKFVNRVAEVSESEGHHPEITFGWGYCTIELYTHKIDGLHENDFILAAKINAI